MHIVMPRIISLAMLAIFVCSPPLAFAGYREELGLTAVELAQLPTFCWAQMEVPNAVGTQFTINDCGPGANHYCPGLVWLLRGKNPTKYGKPLPWLQHADVDIAYTERSIKDYPNCSIRGHVAASRASVNNLLRLYGGKPVPQRK
jgi:hypothetical protein